MSRLLRWRGDITTLSVESIVNASNTSGLGCFTPGHPCIDNAIHRAAGPGLLRECQTLGGIPTGTAKMTWGHDLPCKYIIHTTGPEKKNMGEEEDHKMLAKCYTEVLNLAKQNFITEIAFCCISTGIFGFSKERAATTALKTVKDWLRVHDTALQNGSVTKPLTIVFVTFTDEDELIYNRNLL